MKGCGYSDGPHEFDPMSFFQLVGMGPGLDHIFIRLGPAPPMPLHYQVFFARTCVGTLPCWEPL